VIHPLIVPTPGWSLEEKLAAERADAFGRWKNGEVIELGHFGVHLGRER
jgi:hypothetical protein